MITKNDRIKCDWCGRFIVLLKAESCLVNYTPETPISTETFEHKCEECKQKAEKNG